MTTLTGLPQDITSLVLDNLQIVVLLKVLMTCKQLYAMRKYALSQNAVVRAYEKCDPNTPFICVLFQSDAEFDDNMNLEIKNNIGTSTRSVIYNTYKLFAFHNTYNDCDAALMARNRDVLIGYYATCIGHTAFSTFMAMYNWNYTNIDIFDIYELTLCARKKNFRKCADIVNNMIIEPPRDLPTFTVICESLMRCIEYTYHKVLRAGLIAILFKFLLYVPISMINEKFKKVISMQCDVLSEQINDMKNAPKYLKKIFVVQLIAVKQRLENH